MTDAPDAYREALSLIDQHGDTAPIFAAMEADAALERAGMDAAATWRLVLRAIRGMMAPEGVRH